MNKILQIKESALKSYRTVYLWDILDSGLIGNGVWLSGGALRTLFKPETKVDDFDLFFQNLDLVQTTRERVEALGGQLIYECPLGYLFTYKLRLKEKEYKIQLICEKAYSSPLNLILSFDFFACALAYDGQDFWVPSQAVKDIKTKRLSLLGLSYPVATIKRLFKYQKKGYNINNAAAQIVKEILSLGSQGREFSDEEMRFYVD